MRYHINMRVRGSALVIEDESLLLVEFYTEELGLHYVLPGGSVETGESIRETVMREVHEETCVKIEPGQVVFAYEYNPQQDRLPRELPPPALTLVFSANRIKGKAHLPDAPDPGQTAVRWIPLDELDTIQLSPPIQKQILEWAYSKQCGIDLIEEWRL